MGRIIKFTWLISLLSGLATLMYTYASLGEVVSVNNETLATESGTITREAFFYSSLAILVVFNFTFYAISRNMHMADQGMKQLLINWQLSFAAVLNFFFIIGVLFIMLINSGENFSYGNFGYLVYVALVLILLWLLALPLLIMRQRASKSNI
jgi:hypothetical protein